MAKVVIYTTATCPFCVKAQRLLQQKDVSYENVRVDECPERRQQMRIRSHGRNSVPQIFIDGQHIGGCDELYALEHAGALNKLLCIREE